MERLIPSTTAVVVVDVQERLAPAMPEAQRDALARSARILLSAARLLGAPVFVTEQYPKGLGRTLPEIDELAAQAGAGRFEKLHFSACGAPGFADALSLCGARAIVLIGMETHVCVYQTARDLAGRGYAVHVPIDGVASRRDDHRDVGLSLCERAGALRTTSETVAFDWLEHAGSDVFKQVSRLVR